MKKWGEREWIEMRGRWKMGGREKRGGREEENVKKIRKEGERKGKDEREYPKKVR